MFQNVTYSHLCVIIVYEICKFLSSLPLSVHSPFPLSEAMATQEDCAPRPNYDLANLYTINDIAIVFFMCIYVTESTNILISY